MDLHDSTADHSDSIRVVVARVLAHDVVEPRLIRSWTKTHANTQGRALDNTNFVAVVISFLVASRARLCRRHDVLCPLQYAGSAISERRTGCEAHFLSAGRDYLAPDMGTAGALYEFEGTHSVLGLSCCQQEPG